MTERQEVVQYLHDKAIVKIASSWTTSAFIVFFSGSVNLQTVEWLSGKWLWIQLVLEEWIS